ncbi:MAG: RNA polymerase sigma factor [Desulfobacterales bacterium]|nr:RNA polymerase sigma factor [Desulfobacterales bacterium]
MDDEGQIIISILNGNKNDYAVLVNKYKTAIFNLAYRMTGDACASDDLAQEAFVKAYESLASFNITKKFFPWLFTIALNLIRTYLKKKKYLSFLPNFFKDDRQHPDLNLKIQEESEILAKLLQKLPISDREAIVLRFYDELSFEDVSKILNISLSSAKMRVYRGLKKLRIFMEKI